MLSSSPTVGVSLAKGIFDSIVDTGVGLLAGVKKYACFLVSCQVQYFTGFKGVAID